MTGFAIEWFSKLYPPEVNILHDMIPESKVPYSSNNISMKDLPWMKGVKSDIKNILLKCMILLLMKHQSLCITHCPLVIQAFDTYCGLNHI